MTILWDIFELFVEDATFDYGFFTGGDSGRKITTFYSLGYGC